MRLALPSHPPSASLAVRSQPFAGLMAYASVLTIGVACAQEALLVTPNREEIHQGIVKSVKTQFEACNEENLEKLLAVVSKEMPDRERFKLEVDSFWSGNDAYSILDKVDVLEDSDAPGAEFAYPYATVKITQTVIELKVGNPHNSVFLRKCQKGDRKPIEVAVQLGVLDRVATTSVEVLFKHEDGEWKLVNGLTEPVLAGSTGIGVPAYRQIRVSGSVFNR